jgi:hypothetical protein
MAKKVFEYWTFNEPQTIGILDTNPADRSSVLLGMRIGVALDETQV